MLSGWTATAGFRPGLWLTHTQSCFFCLQVCDLAGSCEWLTGPHQQARLAVRDEITRFGGCMTHLQEWSIFGWHSPFLAREFRMPSTCIIGLPPALGTVRASSGLSLELPPGTSSLCSLFCSAVSHLVPGTSQIPTLDSDSPLAHARYSISDE